MLNLMASRDYPERGMYGQAQVLYNYIYQHPQYLSNKTRLNHVKMLQDTGKEADAIQILSGAAKYLEAKKQQKGLSSNSFRQLGIIYMMLANNTLADKYFDKSIELARESLEMSRIPDEKAKLLWSISRTMEARGDISSSITTIEQAIKHVQSPALHYYLERQLSKLLKL
jgi:tetratricopeptide (TPR) repeat protein